MIAPRFLFCSVFLLKVGFALDGEAFLVGEVVQVVFVPGLANSLDGSPLSVNPSIAPQRRIRKKCDGRGERIPTAFLRLCSFSRIVGGFG